MCAKVLIISGSPRKGGNTDILCDRFAEGARDAGNEVVKIRLAEMSIHCCTGCDSCVNTGRCVFKDGMEDVEREMRAADVMVLASPVYFYTIDAQIKAMIDRTVPFYRDLTDKGFYFIVAAADPNEHMLDLSVECFRGFTRDCLEGATERGIIKATGVWEKGAVKGTDFPSVAYEMGKGI